MGRKSDRTKASNAQPRVLVDSDIARTGRFYVTASGDVFRVSSAGEVVDVDYVRVTTRTHAKRTELGLTPDSCMSGAFFTSCLMSGTLVAVGNKAPEDSVLIGILGNLPEYAKDLGDRADKGISQESMASLQRGMAQSDAGDIHYLGSFEEHLPKKERKKASAPLEVVAQAKPLNPRDLLKLGKKLR